MSSCSLEPVPLNSALGTKALGFSAQMARPDFRVFSGLCLGSISLGPHDATVLHTLDLSNGQRASWDSYRNINRAMVVRGWTWTMWVGVYTYVKVYSSAGWCQEMEEERKSSLGAGFQTSLHHHILKQKSKKSGSLNSNPDIQVVKKLYLSMSKNETILYLFVRLIHNF